MSSKVLHVVALAVVMGAIAAHGAAPAPSTCANVQGDCCADADNGLCGAASCPGNGLGASNSNRVAKTLCTRFKSDCVSSTTGNTNKCLGQTADTQLCIWMNNDVNENAFLCDKCTRTNAGYCNGNAAADPVGTTTPPCSCVCKTGYAGDFCERCAENYYNPSGASPVVCVAVPCTNDNTACNQGNNGGVVTPGRTKVDGCTCNCATGYTGAGCTQCATNYVRGTAANSCVPEPCTNENHDCNNANGGGSVTPGSNKVDGCACNCNAGYTANNCRTCAALYTKLNANVDVCTPAVCSAATYPCAHGTVSGTFPNCVCTCTPGSHFTGADCSVCPGGHADPNVCTHCADGYVHAADGSCRACGSADCNGHEVSVTSPVGLDQCLCTCSPQWSGSQCQNRVCVKELDCPGVQYGALPQLRSDNTCACTCAAGYVNAPACDTCDEGYARNAESGLCELTCRSDQIWIAEFKRCSRLCNRETDCNGRGTPRAGSNVLEDFNCNFDHVCTCDLDEQTELWWVTPFDFPLRKYTVFPSPIAESLPQEWRAAPVMIDIGFVAPASYDLAQPGTLYEHGCGYPWGSFLGLRVNPISNARELVGMFGLGVDPVTNVRHNHIPDDSDPDTTAFTIDLRNGAFPLDGQFHKMQFIVIPKVPDTTDRTNFNQMVYLDGNPRNHWTTQGRTGRVMAASRTLSGRVGWRPGDNFELWSGGDFGGFGESNGCVIHGMPSGNPGGAGEGAPWAVSVNGRATGLNLIMSQQLRQCTTQATSRTIATFQYWVNDCIKSNIPCRRRQADASATGGGNATDPRSHDAQMGDAVRADIAAVLGVQPSQVIVTGYEETTEADGSTSLRVQFAVAPEVKDQMNHTRLREGEYTRTAATANTTRISVLSVEPAPRENRGPQCGTGCIIGVAVGGTVALVAAVVVTAFVTAKLMKARKTKKITAGVVVATTTAVAPKTMIDIVPGAADDDDEADLSDPEA